MKKTLIAGLAAMSLIAFGACGDSEQTEWTCLEEYYGDDYCDCGCGIPDIDCADNSYESCQGGCEEIGYIDPTNPAACVAIEGVGKPCDISLRDKCVGNSVVYCSDEGEDGTLALASPCNAASCEVIQGVADCFFEGDACAPGDGAIQGCAYDYYSVEYSCQATESGKHYYYFTDVTGETWEGCYYGCIDFTGQCY